MQSSPRHVLAPEHEPIGRHGLTVDLEAIRHNASVLLSRGQVSVDLSADAYGHGAAEIARVALEAGATVAPSGAGVVAGAALYGLTDDPDLRPAMRVSALVVGTKTIDAGEGVSYGLTYRAPARTNLALVGIGYADGLDRSAGNIASLLLGGVPRRIVGRVAMNALVLELNDGSAEVGDEAVVFGDPAVGEPRAHDWAERIGRSAAEVTSVFGRHLPRRFL